MQSASDIDRIIEVFADAVVEGRFEAAEGWAAILLVRHDDLLDGHVL